MSRKEIRQNLEGLGETKVRQMLEDGHQSLGGVDSPYQNEVLLWLSEKTAAVAEARAGRADARSEESLSISRKALRNSTWAAIIAITAIIYSARAQLIELFRYVFNLAP